MNQLNAQYRKICYILVTMGCKRQYVCICDALRDLVPFLQFKNRKKHPGRSVTFSKVYFIKSKTSPWVFFTFFKL